MRGQRTSVAKRKIILAGGQDDVAAADKLMLHIYYLTILKLPSIHSDKSFTTLFYHTSHTQIIHTYVGTILSISRIIHVNLHTSYQPAAGLKEAFPTRNITLSRGALSRLEKTSRRNIYAKPVSAII